MGCNCKGTAKPDPQPNIQVIQPKMDEINSPDELVAQELERWKEEQHQVMMDDLKKNQPE